MPTTTDKRRGVRMVVVWGFVVQRIRNGIVDMWSRD
jgi:hypothetical protein